MIVLPPETPRQRSISDSEINHFVDQHGYTGALLCAVREARGMSIQDVSDTTRISTKYLEAFDAARMPRATRPATDAERSTVAVVISVFLARLVSAVALGG